MYTNVATALGSSGIASIDWSGLIGGNVKRWVKGL